MSDAAFAKWVIGGITVFMFIVWLLWDSVYRYRLVREECEQHGYSTEYCETMAWAGISSRFQ